MSVKNFDIEESTGYKERITVDYDPSETFATITRSVKGPNERRFKHVESVAIPRALIAKVCVALGAPEREPCIGLRLRGE